MIYVRKNHLNPILGLGICYLVPARSVSVPLKFQREGIAYDDLSDAEKQEWDEIEWEEDPEAGNPDHIDAEALNRWLFNEDTVDKVLETLMREGQRVANGDRLGKTISAKPSSSPRMKSTPASCRTFAPRLPLATVVGPSLVTASGTSIQATTARRAEAKHIARQALSEAV